MTVSRKCRSNFLRIPSLNSLYNLLNNLPKFLLITCIKLITVDFNSCSESTFSEYLSGYPILLSLLRKKNGINSCHATFN